MALHSAVCTYTLLIQRPDTGNHPAFASGAPPSIRRSLDTDGTLVRSHSAASFVLDCCWLAISRLPFCSAPGGPCRLCRWPMRRAATNAAPSGAVCSRKRPSPRPSTLRPPPTSPPSEAAPSRPPPATAALTRACRRASLVVRPVAISISWLPRRTPTAHATAMP